MSWQTMSADERYAAQIARDALTGCIEWTGCLSGGGYAQMKVGGRSTYVHRWAWERANGPIPEGLFLDHLCRNRLCSNPDHLEPVTFRENVLRGVGETAMNARKGACPVGHAYSDENTYVNTKGSRVCLECKRVGGRAYRARKKLRRQGAA